MKKSPNDRQKRMQLWKYIKSTETVFAEMLAKKGKLKQTVGQN